LKPIGAPGVYLLLIAFLGGAVGCDDESPATPSGSSLGTEASDFAVRDVNPDSPRYDEFVSPRDYLGQVSAWYFGHST